MVTVMTRRRFLAAGCGVMVGVVCAGCGLSAAASGGAASDTAQTARSACPKGLINDPYPGRCRSYRDTNGNGYCDLSEVA